MTLNEIARKAADDIRLGIAWVIFWRTEHDWHTATVLLNPETHTFEDEDMDMIIEILEADPNAVILNKLQFGYDGKELTIAQIIDGIRHHYNNGLSLLKTRVILSNEDTAENKGGERMDNNDTEKFLESSKNLTVNVRYYSPEINDLRVKLHLTHQALSQVGKYVDELEEHIASLIKKD